MHVRRLISATILAAAAAQAIQSSYLDVNAVATNGPSPQVTFTWDAQADWATIEVARRAMGETGLSTNWDVRATVAHPTTTFTDAVVPGVVHEYRLRRPSNESYSTYKETSTFVAVALDAPLADDRGGVLLVVDNTVTNALAVELAQLEMDLAGDGWTVRRLDFGRHGAAQPADLRAAISNAWDASGGTIKALYLFGRLPVVKSGLIAPDGHGWRPHAADGYYADVDGTWTDINLRVYGTVTNAPGDGVYDPDCFPSPLELMVGRVDFAEMTAYRKNEVEYLRDYVHKSHVFRHGLRDVPRRGQWNSGYLWPERNWINSLFGTQNVTYAPFQPEISTNAYLFGIDFGYWDGTSGLYTETPNKLIFGVNFGSWKQQWERPDNEMRGLLAQPEWGLSCVWGGRPSWFFHQMGAGETVGYSARRSMDNANRFTAAQTDYYPNGDYPWMAGYVHMALMGDPTLRLHPVAPPAGVSAAKAGGAAALAWSASPDPAVLGYNVYCSTNRLGPYARLTAAPLAALAFTNAAPPAAEHWYQVRAVKREATAAAVYTNASQGAFAKLSALGAANRAPTAQADAVATSRDQMAEVALAGADADGDAIAPIVLENPRHGRLRWTPTQLLYLPDAGYSGPDSLRFAMSDGTTVGEPAQIDIEIAPAGNLLEWEFASPADGVPQDLACTGHATGIHPATIAAGPKASFRIDYGVYQRDAFCLKGGAVGGLAPDLYVEWQVAPEPLHRFDISGVSFGLWNQDPTKPVHAALRWSADGFATWHPVPVAGQQSVTYAGLGYGATAGMPFAASLADVQALQQRTNAVAFRLYFWYDTASTLAGIGKIGETQIDLAVSGTAISIAPPVVTSATQAEGRLGEPFEYAIAAEHDPTGFAASGLPAWASLDPSAGVISGTPDAAGVSQVQISATNAWGAGTASLEIVVGCVIEATAGEGGTIAPSGRIGVAEGGSQAFAVEAGLYSSIADVLVDGASVGAAADYTFTDVRTNHAIHAVFEMQTTSRGTPLQWLADLGYTEDFEAADLADLDGDGVANWIERRDDTDPQDPLSRPAHNTVPYAESFENLAGWGGAYTTVAGRMGWSAGAGDLSALAAAPQPYAGEPPLPAATHTNVLALDTGVEAVATGFGEGHALADGVTHVDLLVQAIPATERPLFYPAADVGVKAGAYVEADGRLAIYHGVVAADGSWLSNAVTRTAAAVGSNAWFRLSFALDATLGEGAPAMFQARVDGVALASAAARAEGWKAAWLQGGTLPAPSAQGTWLPFATAGDGAAMLREVAFIGNGGVDDLVVATDDPFAQKPPTCLLIVRRDGEGSTSLGGSALAMLEVPLGASTQVVYTAADWHRIASLRTDGAAVSAAAGLAVYTQAFENVSANVSNDVAFALATPEQTGHPGVPTSWLANWTEAAVAAEPDDGFDVPAEYQLGLDPTASNAWALAVESFGLEGAAAVAVARRETSGPLSPDGMHGALMLQHAAALGGGFTNLPATAASGPDAFDGEGRRAFTNAIPENADAGFYRVVVEPVP